MKCKKLIIFDFDGTIADTKKVYLDTIKKTLLLHSYVYSESRIMRALGPKLDESLRNLYRFNPKDLKKIKSEINLKIARQAKSIKLCPNVRNTLDNLKKKGCHLILMTNSARKFCFLFLKHNNLLNYFEKRFYAENFSKKESKIKSLARKYNIPAKEVIYVADRIKDIEVAKKAGCRAIISLSCSWDKHKIISRKYAIKDLSHLESKI